MWREEGADEVTDKCGVKVNRHRRVSTSRPLKKSVAAPDVVVNIIEPQLMVEGLTGNS